MRSVLIYCCISVSIKNCVKAIRMYRYLYIYRYLHMHIHTQMHVHVFSSIFFIFFFSPCVCEGVMALEGYRWISHTRWVHHSKLNGMISVSYICTEKVSIQTEHFVVKSHHQSSFVLSHLHSSYNSTINLGLFSMLYLVCVWLTDFGKVSYNCVSLVDFFWKSFFFFFNLLQRCQ